ncbi:MAG: MATE family efflux transporter [Thalassobaculaceae bacterium]|nr:MATE family efflux transporter [Thalassobaculaceae bacterium]
MVAPAAHIDRIKPKSAYATEVGATLALAIPIAATQLAQMALQTTDVLMTGRLGPHALAAAQLGHNLYFPVFVTILGTLFASSAMFAQELGARRYKGVRRTFRQGFWLILSVTLPSWIYFAHAEDMLVAMGQAPDLAARAQEYCDGVMWGLPFMAGFALLRNFIAAHGRPRPALWLLAIGIPVNALIDYALMFGHFGLPRLELYGLGIATTLVQAAMFFLLLVYILRNRRYRRYMLLIRFWRSDWPRFRELWSVGLPIGLTKLAEAGLFAATGFLIGLIGVHELAGHAVALQFAAIAFMIPFGVAQAATVRVGLAVGRRNPDGAVLASRVATLVGVVVMVPSALIYVFCGEILVSLFLDVGDPSELPAVAHAVTYIAIAGLFQFADGGQSVIAGALRGFKDTRVPMVIALIGYWPIGGGAAVLFAFPMGYGGAGVWAGLALGLFVVWGALALRLRLVAGQLTTSAVPVAVSG